MPILRLPCYPAITALFRAVGLLAAGGASVGLAVAGLLDWRYLEVFALTNQVDAPVRRGMMACLVGGACMMPLIGIAVVARVAEWGERTHRLHNMARRLSPIYWVGLVPLLFHPGLWASRELDFLLLAALFSVGEWFSVETAQAQPALGCERVLSAWFGPVGTGLWAALPGAVRRHWAIALLVVSAMVAAWIRVRQASHSYAGPAWTSQLEFLNHLTRGGGPVGSHSVDGVLESHANFFAYVLAAIYLLVPHPQTYMVVEACLLAGAAVPLFLMTRRQLGPGVAILVALSYLLFPCFRTADLGSGSYLPLALCFFWLAWDGLQTGRIGQGWIGAILALAVDELVAVWTLVLGTYLVFRRRQSKSGLLLAGASGAYLVLTTVAVLPRYGAHPYQGLLFSSDKGVCSALVLLLVNPGYATSRLSEMCGLAALLELVVPLAFLPLVSPSALWLLLPAVLLTRLSELGCPAGCYTHASPHWVALLFVGVTLTLERLKRSSSPGQRRYLPALVALVCAVLPTSYQLTSVLHPSSGTSPIRIDKTDTHGHRSAAYRHPLHSVPLPPGVPRA